MNKDELILSNNIKLSQTINCPELFNERLEVSKDMRILIIDMINGKLKDEQVDLDMISMSLVKIVI